MTWTIHSQLWEMSFRYELTSPVFQARFGGAQARFDSFRTSAFSAWPDSNVKFEKVSWSFLALWFRVLTEGQSTEERKNLPQEHHCITGKRVLSIQLCSFQKIMEETKKGGNRNLWRGQNTHCLNASVSKNDTWSLIKQFDLAFPAGASPMAHGLLIG